SRPGGRRPGQRGGSAAACAGGAAAGRHAAVDPPLRGRGRRPGRAGGGGAPMSRAEPGRPLTAVPHPSPSNRPAGPPRPAEEGTGPMGDRAAEPRWLELRLPSRPENVGVARVAVAAFAAELPFTLSELEEIKVAVSEAVTNAVVHGYGHGRGVVTIRAGHDGRRLWVEVADSGRGIADIEQARQPAFSTDPERMGMGFAFMEAFMDQVDVESAP